jgi:hypothetical protein
MREHTPVKIRPDVNTSRALNKKKKELKNLAVSG